MKWFLILKTDGIFIWVVVLFLKYHPGKLMQNGQKSKHHFHFLFSFIILFDSTVRFGLGKPIN